METNRCPNCGASTVTKGQFWDYSHHRLGRLRFEPLGMRRFSFRWIRGVGITEGAHCCLSCGHVWASLKAEQLRSYIERYGNQYAKGELEPFKKSTSDQEMA
jgi:hypothetical protein